MLLIEQYKDKIAEKIDNRSAITKAQTLSFIIVTYNNGKELIKCIESLQQQSCKNFEIIVIDNGRTDEIYVSQITMQSLFYIKLKQNYGPCVGRNIGMCLSQTDIVAFIDDDAVIHKDYAQNAMSFFREPDHYGFQGKIKFKTSSIYNYLEKHYDIGEEMTPYFLSIECNCALRKKHIVDVEGWDESVLFLRGGCEGVLLSYKLVNRYGREGLLYFPKAIVYHDFSHTLVKLLRKYIRFDFIRSYLEKTYPQAFSLIFNYYLRKRPSYQIKLNMIKKIKLFCIRKLRDAVRRTLRASPILQRFVFGYFF